MPKLKRKWLFRIVKYDHIVKGWVRPVVISVEHKHIWRAAYVALKDYFSNYLKLSDRRRISEIRITISSLGLDSKHSDLDVPTTRPSIPQETNS